MMRLMRPRGNNWYLEGNTFAVRSQLKALGAQWRPTEKVWVVAQTPQAEAALRALGFEHAIPVQAVLEAQTPETSTTISALTPPFTAPSPLQPHEGDSCPQETSVPPGCLTVRALLSHLRGLVAKSFPQALWVEGDVQDLNCRKGHYFFQLVETPGEGTHLGRPWSVRCVLWQGRAQGLDPQILSIVQEGVRVRIQAHVELRPEGGEVTLQVVALDPRLTLGEMALRRRALVKELQKRGLYGLNREKPFPPLPLTIALITSPESRAVHDFVHELQLSQLGFVVHVLPATMQGLQTSPSVSQALRCAQALNPDVLVVTRGGGSRVDLHWFDDLEICKSIAYSPVPVVTAIGHFEDVSVADEVAWRGEKTPTGAARFLTNHVLSQWSTAQGRLEALGTRVRSRLQGAHRDLASRASLVASRAHLRLQRESLRWESAQTRLPQATQRRLTQEAQKLSQAHQLLTLAKRSLLAPLARGYARLEGSGGQPLAGKDLLDLAAGTPFVVVVQGPGGSHESVKAIKAP